jgi:DNA-binding CsgD family transcriptional regulator
MGNARGPYRTQMRLTDRQREVLELISKGKTNGEIARALGITLDGAKYHVSEILTKMDASSREEAVVVWREYQRPISRMRRLMGGATGLWAATGPGGKATAAGLVAATAIVVGVAVAWPRGETAPPAGAPETAEEFIEQMTNRVSGDGRVLYLEADTFLEDEDGVSQRIAGFTAWLDMDEDAGRLDFSADPESELDIAEYWTIWWDGPDIYQLVPDDAAPRLMDAASMWPPCVDGVPPLIAPIVCGWFTTRFEGSNARVVDGVEWDGRQEIALVFEDIREQTGPTGPATTTTEYSFFVDAGTYVPLALTMTSVGDGAELGELRVEYQSDLLGGGDVDRSLFDPRAAGYRPQDEIDMDLLDQVTRDHRVYWAGREATLGDPIERVSLRAVEERFAPPRPSLISLRYETDDGALLYVEVWNEDGWLGFLDMLDEAHHSLGGSYPLGTECPEVVETDIDGARFRILGGYDPELEPAGEEDASASAAPGGCPPANSFTAGLYIDGFVVTLNAPIGLFGWAHRAGPFNSVEALITFGEALRQREPGE